MSAPVIHLTLDELLGKAAVGFDAHADPVVRALARRIQTTVVEVCKGKSFTPDRKRRLEAKLGDLLVEFERQVGEGRAGIIVSERAYEAVAGACASCGVEPNTPAAAQPCTRTGLGIRQAGEHRFEMRRRIVTRELTRYGRIG